TWLSVSFTHNSFLQRRTKMRDGVFTPRKSLGDFMLFSRFRLPRRPNFVDGNAGAVKLKSQGVIIHTVFKHSRPHRQPAISPAPECTRCTLFRPRGYTKPFVLHSSHVDPA